MNYRPGAERLITDAHVDEILAELNTSGAALDSLEPWAARPDLKPDRVIHGPDISYIRLPGQAEGGGPVVLMHFEHVWERATKRSPSLPGVIGAQGRTAPRLARLGGRMRKWGS